MKKSPIPVLAALPPYMRDTLDLATTFDRFGGRRQRSAMALERRGLLRREQLSFGGWRWELTPRAHALLAQERKARKGSAR